MGKKADTQMVFQRYEIKYLLNRRQKEKLLQAMEPYMEPDRYGHSIIRNIYYDTDNYRLVRASLEKPAYKEKLRVRSYKQADYEDEVFVELKRKFDSVVYKRRAGMGWGQAADYLARRMQAPEKTQITEEIDYFLEFYGRLEPRVFLSYEREAYAVKNTSSTGQEQKAGINKEERGTAGGSAAARPDTGKVSGSLRITFDENILWRETDLSLEKGIYGAAILEPGQVLMEIKTSGGLPLWIVEILSREKIWRTTFSKYGNAYQKIMREKGEYIYA